MNKLLKRAAVFLLAGSTLVHAAEMDITASFSPSMSNPENNAFTNTTPNGGYCAIWPNYCHGKFSIELPFSLRRTQPLMANAEPRDGIYYKMPSAWRKVEVVNTTDNNVATVQFRIDLFSARYLYSGSNISWDGGVHLGFAQTPCSTAMVPVGAGGAIPWMHFAWNYPATDAACYRISTVDRDDQGNNFLNPIEQMSIGYELVTPNPLLLTSGNYVGVLNFTIGPGGDFDFGDNYQASDNNLTINFTLSVNHELKLTTTAEDRQVSLQPCAPGRVCTEEEGKANWERWMVNRIAPQMTGRSNFTLSSSGAFTVFLQCGQQIGQDCVLQSEKNAQQVPVQALLTLPENIVDQSTGATVSRRALRVGKDTTHNIFNTRSFGENRKGSIDFVVAPKDVESMLKTRPDTYKGTVTVIFDPLIY